MLALEWSSVALALAYLALAIRQSLWCWPAAMLSTAFWLLVVVDARLYMDAALQVFYFAMAIYGWRQWKSGGFEGTGVRVHWWPASRHVLVLSAIAAVSAVFGYMLSSTEAAFPYLDSLTTVAAVVATFMVTRKVIENWIYWLVIDSIYIYLYIERSLYAYAALYAIYLVMVVFGFLAWVRSLQSEKAGSDASAFG